MTWLPGDNNGLRDVFVRDLVTQTTVMGEPQRERGAGERPLGRNPERERAVAGRALRCVRESRPRI
jgi:hypothetical protein